MKVHSELSTPKGDTPQNVPAFYSKHFAHTEDTGRLDGRYSILPLQPIE